MPIFHTQAIGLDISDHAAEAVLIVRKGLQNVLASHGRVSLPPGVVVDGYVERRAELSLILRKLLADQMRPPLPKGSNRIVFALPESQVYKHIFEVPRLADERKLGDTLPEEADGFFPYHHDKMAAGFTVINRSLDKKEIYYAAVHEETLKSFLLLFAVSGLTPIAVESESVSIARAVFRQDEPGPAVLIDIRARATDITVFDRDVIQFSESIEVAGDAFTQALSNSLSVSALEAEAIKHAQGLSDALDPKGRKALLAAIDRLVTETREAISFYEERDRRPVRKILVCGGSSLMPGLFDDLSKRLSNPEKGTTVQLADPWTGLRLDPSLEKIGLKSRGVLLSTAIGLGLRGAGIRTFSDIDFLQGVAQRPDRPSSKGAAKKELTASKEFPGRGKWPRWLKVCLAIVATILVACLWQAVVTFAPNFMRRPQPIVQAPVSIDLEAKAALGDTFSEEKDVLGGVPLAVEITTSETFKREVTPSEGKSAGHVTIINNTGKPQTLVARTRLTSPDGILFRLDDRVQVGAASRLTVSVTADAPGAQGDVAPGHFLIPGLALALQSQIYAESQEAMHGGLIYIGGPYTAEEATAAEAKLKADASEELFKQAVTNVGSDLAVLKDLFTVTAAEPSETPKVGAPVGDYSMTVHMKAKAIAISVKEAGLILRKALAARAADPSKYDLSAISYSVQDFNPETASASVTLKTTASLRR